VGEEGLQRLARARVILVGCGTLGGAYAQHLVRLGVGSLVLVDRDVVEEANLSTQLLFDEDDVQEMRPKAVAAGRRLERVNTRCRLEARVADLSPGNVREILDGADLILDASDNFEVRFLINDAAVKWGIPWIYTAITGWAGLVMAVVPGKSACLRCLIPEPPEPGSLPTCETAGVWAPAAAAVASTGLTAALRLLLGQTPSSELHELDFEADYWRRIPVPRRADCPACARGDFPFLEGRRGSQAVRMCGRDMVHLAPEAPVRLDLPSLAQRLAGFFPVRLTDYLLHVRAEAVELYLFPDGRAFIKGVTDPGRARAIYNRYVTG
jgi:adenylyltransferase/sulfurtransferase